MSFNINHPNFIKFLESLTETIYSNTNDIKLYYSLNQESKMVLIYSVYKVITKTLNDKIKIDNSKTKIVFQNFLNVSLNNENYELSGILKDIINNFESISESTKPEVKKPKRTVKIETEEQ
jgi:hypothetical protein